MKRCLIQATDQHADNMIGSGGHTHSRCHCVSEAAGEAFRFI